MNPGSQLHPRLLPQDITPTGQERRRDTLEVPHTGSHGVPEKLWGGQVMAAWPSAPPLTLPTPPPLHSTAPCAFTALQRVRARKLLAVHVNQRVLVGLKPVSGFYSGPGSMFLQTETLRDLFLKSENYEHRAPCPQASTGSPCRSCVHPAQLSLSLCWF